VSETKVSTSKIRQGWKRELAKHGFRLEGSVFTRKRGVLLQLIGVQRNMLSKTWKVNTSICITDEFMERPELRVCLTGNVASDGARCYDDKKSWWREENIPTQLDAILKFGIPWLDDFADPAKLIHLLEMAVEQYTSVASLLEPRLRDEHARPWFLKSAPIPGQSEASGPPRPAPRHFYLLSLLYYATGNFERGCNRARIWLNHVSDGRTNGEPGRTLRLLAAMGCGPRDAGTN